MLSARPVGLPLDSDRVNLTKTPGRALAKTRNVLQENALRNAPMTVIGKSRKLIQNTPLGSKTLQTEPLKDPPGKQVGSSKLRETPAIRPLGDKTPFPNRTAPQGSLLATGAKIPKPALVDGSLRPSSARKHVRLPRNSSQFETPITNGKHWDVSDIEIEVDTAVANQSIEEENYDEIEYMPPKVEDVPYEPPFEMPNYREVGKTLMAMIRSYTLEDDPPSTADVSFTVHESEKNFFDPPSLPQPEIEDDGPFARPKPEREPEVKSKPAPIATSSRKSPVASKPTIRAAPQRATSVTRPTPSVPSHTPSTLVRKPSTATIRPPVASTRISSSQPVTRVPTSQSTTRPPVARATTRASSTVRSSPLARASATLPSRTTPVVRSTTRPAVKATAPIGGKPGSSKPVATAATPAPPARRVTPSNLPSNSSRPRSGTITKEAFESNTHMTLHVANTSLEDVKKDLEGLIVFDDAFDDDDEFRFDV